MKLDENKPCILVSACLLGNKVRYDGKSCLVQSALALTEFFNVIPVCPEMDSGMPNPRDPSEIKGNKVYSNKGKDVTAFYQKGAEIALNIAKKYNVRIAVLKDRSPSCGSLTIHDGLFDNKVIKGQGFTAKLLRANGIEVISENELDQFVQSEFAKRDGDR
jgi:uncharacterized protein YbbK (DUF523 family)